MKRENKYNDNIENVLEMAITFFIIAVCSLMVFGCGRVSATRMPDKYKYLPLNEIESVTETDGVIIMITENGDHYAFEVDERR